MELIPIRRARSRLPIPQHRQQIVALPHRAERRVRDRRLRWSGTISCESATSVSDWTITAILTAGHHSVGVRGGALVLRQLPPFLPRARSARRTPLGVYTPLA